LENVLDHAEIEALANIKQLDVEWVNAASVHANRNLTMQLRVTESGAAVPGARLIFRFARPDASPFYTQAVTDAAGSAGISIDVEESALSDSSVLVQATHQGRTATRKFALRKTE
jgi:glutamine synthetase